MSERWNRVRSVFERAIELDGSARESWLRESCGEDADLLAEVRGMLQADEGADSLLDSDARAALGQGADLDPTHPRHSLGGESPGPPQDTIGPYRLLKRIGAGGMGEVWLAEQRQPVRRDVALKIIRPGMDSSSVLARFAAERQALARMDHPAIARVYDAGTTEQGRPYFVMEHIRGLPITKFCDERRLTTRERLDLLLQVCEGVQHAHQRGIIHRDLKPSNVMVTTEDERPAPKIIDFGVAKATEGRLSDQTLHTVVGEMVGTPEYMSPEQADLTEQDIDVRTDVYALGVLLYELLTGALPFESRELRQQSFDEIRRRIREDDPPTPSTRFGTLGGDLPTATARARRTDPTRLRRELKGDLDWIVMRALEKERARRYGSPGELAADIRRHLANEPVLAGPPSAAYRMGKFARRHRVAVGFAAVLAVFLAGFVVTMALQARRIALESARTAEQAYRFNLLVVQGEIEAGRLNAAAEFLDAAPEPLRGWEWRHLTARLDPSVRRFDEPRAAAAGVEVSPDGRFFVTSAPDGTLLQRSSATGAVIRGIRPRGVPRHWAISGDNRELHAVGTDEDGRAWLASWDLADGRQLGFFALYEGLLPGGGSGFAHSDVSFDFDRRRVVVLAADRFLAPDGGANEVRVIDLDSPASLRVRVFDAPVRCPTSNGDRVLVAENPWRGRGDILILDAETLETRGRLARYHDVRTGIAVSPDETRVATIAMDGRLQLWDLAAAEAGDGDGEALFDIETQQGDLRGARFSEDGSRLFTFGSNRTIRIWDATTGAPLQSLPGRHERTIAMDLVSGDQEIVALDPAGVVEFYSTGQDGPDVLMGHHSFVYPVDIDHDLGLVLSGGWDGFEGRAGCLRLWDLESGDPVAAWGDDSLRTFDAGFVPGEHALLARSTRFPRAGVARETPAGLDRVDLDTGEIRHLSEMGDRVGDLILGRRSSRAWSIDIDGNLESIDTATGAASRLRSFDFESDLTGPVTSWHHRLAVTDDERTLAVAFGPGHLGLYGTDDLEPLHELPRHSAPINALAFDPAGRRLLSASEDGIVHVWDVRSGREVGRLVGHDRGVLCARFSPSGARIASGGRDGTLRIWGGDAYEPLIALTGHDSYIFDLAWTEDGETLVTTSGDHTLRIWETRPIGERYRARRERREIVERLTPRIDAWLASSQDPAPARFLEAAPDLSAREQQVARQILLGRRLGTSP